LAQAQALYTVIKTQTQTANIVKDKITQELNAINIDDATRIRIQSTMIDFLQTNLEQLNTLTKELVPKSEDITEEQKAATNQKLDGTIRPVPNLLKLDLYTAAERTRALDMKVVPVGEDPSYSNIAPGLIVSQNPTPGTMVQVVSNDPEQIPQISVILSRQP